MLHVGIIGCGKIAQVRHLPEYAANPHVKIAGLYDINADRTREIAKQYKAHAYPSYQQLLDDPKIDAVSVCAANNSHAEITCAALKAGKHVLCEKPMATTLADCESMVAVAKRHDRYLMVDQNQRLAPAHVKAHELVQGGAIGRVLTFRTTFGHSGPENWTVDPGKTIWFFDKMRASMGVLADLGIHKTDLIQYLTGQTVIETTARLCTLDKKTDEGDLIDVDDNAICIYRLDGGVTGTMTASWTYYGGKEDNSTILYGTEGVLRIYDDPAHPLVLVHRDGAREEFDVGEIQTNAKQTKSGVIDLFVRCLEEGLQEMSGESVLKAMRAVFASIESSEKGRTIKVNQ